MLEPNIELPGTRTVQKSAIPEIKAAGLSYRLMNKIVNHLTRQMEKKHPINSEVRDNLTAITDEISKFPYKDTDLYWSHICDNITDPLHRMKALVMLQKNVLHLTEREILQSYLNRLRYKQSTQPDFTKPERILRSLGNLVGPSDIATLIKDPVLDVCDPNTYAKRTPNCIQVSTVFSWIFSSLGQPAVPVVISGGIVPHVGILLSDKNQLLKFSVVSTGNGGEMDVARITGLKSLMKFKATPENA